MTALARDNKNRRWTPSDNQRRKNFLPSIISATIINTPRHHLAILIVAKPSSRLSRYTAPPSRDSDMSA